MEQKSFARNRIGCSDSMWCAVLSGNRNFGYKYAKKTAKVLGTKIAVWMYSDEPAKERREAWDKYMKKTAKRRKSILNI